MGKTTALRRELKARFVPRLEADGFTLDERDAPTFWIFRRASGASAHLFSVQWEKYGRPRFRVDVGSCPGDGLTLAGRHVEWQEMHPHWLPGVASLQPSTRFLSGGWFRQDRPWPLRFLGGSALRDPAEVVDDLLAGLPDVEAFWATGANSSRIRLWTRQ